MARRIDVMDLDISSLGMVEQINRDKGFNYVYVDEGTGYLVGCFDNPPSNAKPIGEFFADVRKRMTERGNAKS